MSEKIVTKLARWQWLIGFFMKFLGTLGIMGCVAEGYPIISGVILSTAGGLVQLNTYIDKNK